MKLSGRLAAIAALTPDGAKVADIGTDHAYLPVYLVLHKRVRVAIAGELRPGPYLTARDTIENYGLQAKIDLRLGDGLAVLAPGEVDTVVIAGMGGNTIIEILSRQKAIAAGLERLILQPMTGAPLLRAWLINNGWYIADEELVQEEKKLYEIVVAVRGISPPVNNLLLEIGPALWNKKPPLLKVRINRLLSQTRALKQALSASNDRGNIQRREALDQKITALEVMRSWL